MKKVITRDQVKKYNEMIFASIGTPVKDLLLLPREERDDDTKRWIGDPYGYKEIICECFEDATYYIKTIKGHTYIYMDLDGEPATRSLLDDSEIARLFFGV